MEISGIVIDEEGTPLPFVHIILVSKRKGTIANANGIFSFVAELNDSVVFSSVGFKKKGIIIPDSLTMYHYPTEIVLQRDTIYLSEVEIYPWATYEEFKEAFIHLTLPETDMDRAYKNFEIIKFQLQFDYTGTPDPSINYKYLTQTQTYYSMNKGLMPPSLRSSINNPLFNWVAWANLIQMIKESKFKKKNR